jgi:transposase
MPRGALTCPEGQTTTSWTAAKDRCQGPLPRTAAKDRRSQFPREMITVKFARAKCHSCPSRTHCTKQPQRTLTLHPQEHEQALRAAREREQAQEFAQAYAQRAGIESTHAQGLRRCGLRRSRYIGQSKTHLQHVLIAVSLNLAQPRSTSCASAPGSKANRWLPLDNRRSSGS